MNTVATAAVVAAIDTGAELATEPLEALITVPETTLPNGIVVPSFRVTQYLASKGADGLATSTAEGLPWVDITYFGAVEASLGTGANLLTELQALAIAYNISQVPANWTGGAVNAGSLKQGLRNDTVDEAQPGCFVPPDADEDRWFVLSNGERICDPAGNAYSWVFDNVQGDERGVVAKAFTDDSPSINTAPHACFEKGMGWFPDAGRDWSGYALIRGGYWYSEDNAGVFRLGGDSPDFARGGVGFRYTK